MAKNSLAKKMFSIAILLAKIIDKILLLNSLKGIA